MENDFTRKQELDLQNEEASISQVRDSLKHAIGLLDEMKNKSENISKQQMNNNQQKISKLAQNRNYKIIRKHKFIPYRKQARDTNCQENTEVSIFNSLDDVEIEDNHPKAVASPFQEQIDTVNRDVEIEEEESADDSGENFHNQYNNDSDTVNKTDTTNNDDQLANRILVISQKIDYFEDQLDELNFSHYMDSDE